MDYLRKTVSSTVLDTIFDLPPALRNTNVEVIILSIDPQFDKSKNAKLMFDFVDAPPLPDSFFDPLPEEELQAWEL